MDSVYAALYLNLSSLISRANTSLIPRKKRSQNSNLGLSLFPSAPCLNTSLNCELTIICRRARITIAEKEAIAQDTQEALARKEAEAEERRKQSHDLVAESIRRELAESGFLIYAALV